MDRAKYTGCHEERFDTILGKTAKQQVHRIIDLVRRHPLSLLLIISFLYYLTFFNYGLVLDDEGFLLQNAESVLHGQWPMVDFFSYQPLSYFLLAGFFELFGNSVLTERILLLTLILVNVWLLFCCARKLLPPRWAWLPAALYAFAPGPWYKVFFISHLILTFAAFLYFSERVSARRALLVGVTVGVAAISRVEAAVLSAILITGLLPVLLWHAKPDDVGCKAGTLRARVGTLFKVESSFWVGLGIVIAAMIGSYWAAGKLPSLVEHIQRYYAYGRSVEYINSNAGIASVFSVTRLVTAPSLEMWFYAIGMAVCLINFVRFSLRWLMISGSDLKLFLGITAAAFGVGSMGYTYFYVWNSRMLSSFAIVYINYFVLLAWICCHLSRLSKNHFPAKVVAVVGLLVMGFFLSKFIVVQDYSGSYTTRDAPMTTVNVPVLRGIHIYADQREDIEKLLKLTAGAGPRDYLVSMSEATTMGYISHLRNPTYYRLFTSEFAPRGEQERAIRTFEHYKIRYFVARRSQFLKGGGPSSDLARYAPKIKAWLLNKYDVIPLGNYFVLLERKNRD